MDKRTLLAVVISVVVITVGFTIQSLIFAPEQSAKTQAAQTSQSPNQTTPATGQPSGNQSPAPAQQTQTPAVSSTPAGNVVPVSETGLTEQTHVIETDLFRVTFTNVGGDVTSFELLKHKDGNHPVDMVDRGNNQQSAFALRFGGPDAAPVTALFHFRQINKNTVEFYRSFYIQGHPDKPFTIRKQYEFKNGDYLMNLSISVENSVNEYLPLNFDKTAYTLSYGPQIGPTFTSLDGRNDYRKFIYLTGGKKKEINLKPDNTESVTQQVDWAAIVGKYFSVIAVPDAAGYTTVFSTRPAEGIPAADRLYLERPVINASKITDVFRFYVGPKVQKTLDSYDRADGNAWALSNLKFGDVQDSRVLLGWLENILKFFLQLFHKVIPNYGVAIILVTILVKIVLYPLTRKSFQSTARMQQLAPKIEELKAKYKDNPNKMNQEMAALYKKEGVNPIGGCLPMLLQFPIFIAMYGLFNNSFDLRGATFIPGWISDLSAPESIWHFGNSFQLPILGWTDLRLLPIIYVASQIISSRLTQTPGTTSNSQMKLMTLGLPIVFFFILYNVPSGLLVYWIVTNVLSAGQQYYITRIRYPHLHPNALAQSQQKPPAKKRSKAQTK